MESKKLKVYEIFQESSYVKKHWSFKKRAVVIDVCRNTEPASFHKKYYEVACSEEEAVSKYQKKHKPRNFVYENKGKSDKWHEATSTSFIAKECDCADITLDDILKQLPYKDACALLLQEKVEFLNIKGDLA